MCEVNEFLGSVTSTGLPSLPSSPWSQAAAGPEKTAPGGSRSLKTISRISGSTGR